MWIAFPISLVKQASSPLLQPFQLFAETKIEKLISGEPYGLEVGKRGFEKRRTKSKRVLVVGYSSRVKFP